MNNIQIKKLILPVLFIAMITVISAMSFYGQKQVYSENEKRRLAEFPELSWESIKSGEFQSGLENYISDHLFGRDFFVGVDAYVNLALGKNSLNDIYKADDGYLVNSPGNQTSEKNLKNFEKNIKVMETFSIFNGIKATAIIIPSSGYIMQDKLPAFHMDYNDKKLLEKASKSAPSVKFIDAQSSLTKAYKAGKQVYYKTDHHITSEGSYAIYDEYCKVSGFDCPTKEQYKITKYDDFYGSTYSGSGYWLNDADTMEVWDLGEDVTVTLDYDDIHNTMFFDKHLKSKDKYPLYLDGNHGVVRIDNPNATGGTLLVVRDSFAQNFVPFLTHNYKTIHMVDMRYFRNSLDSVLGGVKPDEVLYIYGIDTLLDDGESLPWLLMN